MLGDALVLFQGICHHAWNPQASYRQAFMELRVGELLSHPEFVEGRYWTRRLYAVNDTIISEGEFSGDIYLVRDGIVRVTGNTELEQGGVIHPGLCDLGAGEFSGEAGLLPHLPRMATVTAVTECELAAVDGEQLLAFFERHPDAGFRFMLAIYEQTASRLDRTNRRLLRLLAWGLRAHRITSHLEVDPEVAVGVEE